MTKQDSVEGSGKDLAAPMSAVTPAAVEEITRRKMFHAAAVGGAVLAGAAALSRPGLAFASGPTDPSLFREAPEPTEPTHVATKGYVDAKDLELTVRIDNLDPEISVLSPASGQVTVDFSAEPLRIHTLSGDASYVSAGLAPGKSVTLWVSSGGAQRTVSFPAEWKFVSARPTTLAANKTAVLAITAFGGTDAQCVAAWANES